MPRGRPAPLPSALSPSPQPGLPWCHPRGQRTQPGIRLQAEELKEEEGVEELTSETTDGHCARLVVRVHSLKLREEGTE